jgi:CDP-diacylglycerol--glycerol-3-phosphate 3-phosphatidyltransferase
MSFESAVKLGEDARMSLRIILDYPRQLGDRAASLAARAGVKSWHLSVAAMALALLSGVLFYKGHPAWAAAAYLASGMASLLDSAMKERSAGGGAFDALLRPAAEVVADAAVLGGVLLYYAAIGADTYVALALMALVGSFLRSFPAARAEGDIKCSRAGLFQRPEQVMVLVLGGFIGRIPAALVLLAVGNWVSASIRFLCASRSLSNDSGKKVNDQRRAG